MVERLPKIVLTAGALSLPFLIYMAYTRPFYFSSPSLASLIGIEFLFAALLLYRRIFFALILLVFLFAGTDLLPEGMWNAVRWLVLMVGASAGCCIMMLREPRTRLGRFHILALFAVLSAMVSAAVSRYPSFSLLKAVSLLLLFAYAATGARLAVAGRENRFFAGLLLGCEIFVAGIGAFYALGREVMGNPNALGAVMSFVAPILLWGTLVDQRPLVHHRRLFLYAASMYMLFHSYSRAGLLAGFCTSALLCVLMRRYKLLGQGIIILIILGGAVAIFTPEVFSATLHSLTTQVVYKDKDPALGVFGSRRGPWKKAVDSISQHLWLGSGFGTSNAGEGGSAQLGKFSSSADATSENGSSYLTIVSWVGVLGVVPFLLVLLVLLKKLLDTLRWMVSTGSPFHAAVPIAMVVVAGLLHAAFEDWLFAPGSYLCVFFWSFAFVLVDIAPSTPRIVPLQRASNRQLFPADTATGAA